MYMTISEYKDVVYTCTKPTLYE